MACLFAREEFGGCSEGCSFAREELGVGDFDISKSVPHICHCHFQLSCTYLRFEIMNDELCWGIIDFRMLFTGFLALIIDLFADLTVEILFSQVALVYMAGFSQVAVVRWVFAGIFGWVFVFVCLEELGSCLEGREELGDFDTGKSVPHICHCHCSCLFFE